MTADGDPRDGDPRDRRDEHHREDELPSPVVRLPDALDHDGELEALTRLLGPVLAVEAEMLSAALERLERRSGAQGDDDIT